MASLFGAIGGAVGGGVIGRAVVEIVGNNAQLKTVLAESKTETAATADSAAASGGKMGAAWAAGAAVAGIAALEIAKHSIEAADNLERVRAQSEAVIKSTGGAAHVSAQGVEEYARQLAQLTGINHIAVQASENLLLTFPNIRNEAGKNNDIFNQSETALLNMATALNHGAIPSEEQLHASSIRLGKALNDPLTGLTALRRVGVAFTEDQKAQIKTLVDSGDIMGAQKIILHELSREFGGAAVAAGDTFGGSVAKLNDEVTTLFEEIGSFLIPILHGLTDILGPLLHALGPVVDVLGHIVPILTKIMNPGVFFLDWLHNMTEGSDRAFGGLIKFSGAADKAGDAAQGAGEKSHGAARAADELATAQEKAATAARDEYLANLKLAGGFLSIESSVISLREAERNLTDAQDKLHKLQDRGKEGTEAYAEAKRAVRQADLDAVNAEIALTQAVQQYAQDQGKGKISTQDTITQLQLFGHQAGLSQGEINSLIHDIERYIRASGDVPDAHTTKFDTMGIDEVMAQIRNLRQWIDRQQADVTVNAAMAKAVHQQRHSGGRVSGVGEQLVLAQGGELVVDRDNADMAEVLLRSAGLLKFHDGGRVPDIATMVNLAPLIAGINEAIRDTARQAQTAGITGSLSAPRSAIVAAAHAAVASRWGEPQWPYFVMVENREAGWNPHAQNPSSGAYGLPQALPFTKMPKAAWPESAGGQSDWRVQLAWMLDYIAGAYGNPQGAWAHETAVGWYDEGGMALSSHVGVMHRGDLTLAVDSPRSIEALARAMRQAGGGSRVFAPQIHLHGVIGDERNAAFIADVVSRRMATEFNRLQYVEAD